MARKTKTKTQRRLNTPIKKAAEPPVTEEAFKHAEPVRITPSLERQQWLDNCPDPNLILRMEA